MDNNFEPFKIIENSKTFFPEEIYDYSINKFNFFYVIKINNTTLKIARVKKSIPKNIENYIEIIKSIRNALKNNTNKINIYAYQTPFKKKWNLIDELTNINVNSGFTTFRDNSTNIVIFRKEEFKKVLIHELLHALEIHCVYSSTIERFDEDSSPDESIVETWATLLYCYYKYCKLNNIKFIINFENISINKKFNNMLKTKEFKKQKKYILRKSALLLKLYECENIDINCIQKFPLNPAVFYYYICKSSFLFNIMLFLEVFNINNISNCKKIPFDFMNDKFFSGKFEKFMFNKSKKIKVPKELSMKMTTKSF